MDEPNDFIPQKRQSVVRKDAYSQDESKCIDHQIDEASANPSVFVLPTTIESTPESTEAAEWKRKRGYVIREFISSEENYYKRLQLTFDLYVAPLRKLEIIESSQINTQFYNWDLLVGLHKDLYENMVLEHDAGTLNLGARFKTFSHFLKCYSQYLTNFDRARNERAKLLTSNKKFSAFVEKVENSPESQQLPLESFLMEPVQRVPRYRLLLEQLLKYTPNDHPEREAVIEALALTAGVAQANSDALADRDMQEKIMSIMMSLNGATRVNLIDDPSRVLLLDEVLERQCRRGVKEFRFWLFSDKLLYGDKLVTGQYSLNRDISLHACRARSLLPIDGESQSSSTTVSRRGSTFGMSQSLDTSTDSTSFLEADYCATEGHESSQKVERSGGVLDSNALAVAIMGIADENGKDTAQSVLRGGSNSSSSSSPNRGWASSDCREDFKSFVVESPQKSFQVWAPTEARKHAWISAINSAAEALQKQNSASGLPAPLWTPDTAVKRCQRCQVKFGLITRIHHCRVCGSAVCDCCSKNRCSLPHVDETKLVRVCIACYSQICTANADHPS